MPMFLKAFFTLSLAATPGSQVASHEIHGMAGADDAAAARIEIRDRMHQGLMISFSGDAEVDFIGMIPHHRGTDEVAEHVIQHGQDSELRVLAEDIIAAQETETAMMQEWLRARGLG